MRRRKVLLLTLPDTKRLGSSFNISIFEIFKNTIVSNHLAAF